MKQEKFKKLIFHQFKIPGVDEIKLNEITETMEQNGK